MIECKKVSFSYPSNESIDGEREVHGTLKNIDLSINDGDFVLLCGTSGCGKTTLTRLFNGLIPHYYDGKLEGRVILDGKDMSSLSLFDISKKVGSVFQNPRSQFFNVDTTSEIAFGCENLGLPEKEIRERMNVVADQLEMDLLLDRDIFQLSGGEKQRVACASVSAMMPEVFVLDEPTSNLDKESIERLKNTLLLWKKQGKTIVIAEHRLYWLKEICDRVVYLEHGRIMFDITMQEFLKFSEQKLQNLGLRTMQPHCDESSKRHEYIAKKSDIVLKNYYFSYGEKKVLEFGDMQLPKNELIAITGQNGAGKSTFVRCFCGLEKKFKGQTVIEEKQYKPKEMLRKCYLVMQDVNHQLFCESVEDEVLLGASDTGKEIKERAKEIMQKLGIWEFRDKHPMSLSGGQKQRVAIASSVLAEKEILIFDEPTSGLDYYHMVSTAQLFKELRDMGKSIFIITHDRELIERCCNYEFYVADRQATLYGL